MLRNAGQFISRRPGAVTLTNILSGDAPQPTIESLDQLGIQTRVATNLDQKPEEVESNKFYTPPTTLHQLVVITDSAAVNPQNTQLGFLAHSIRYSNYTKRWVWIEALAMWLPPGQIGAVFQVPGGTQNCKVAFESPPNVTNPNVGSGQIVVVDYIHDFLMPDGGISLTAVVI